MKFIDFFAEHIKPYTIKGKRMLNPADTEIVSNGVSCIREYDVNMWFYSKGNTTIAIDSGYKNHPSINIEFKKINLDPSKISAVFFTHADIDHSGGMDKNSTIIFPNGRIYLGENEEIHLLNTIPRFGVGPIKINNSIEFNEGYQLLKDGETVKIGDIDIVAISTPGHTNGHMSYIVDNKILFTGDSIAINKTGGYCLFDFFNIDSQMNIKSLRKLKDIVKDKPIEMICTGHSGYCDDVEHAFKHIDEIAQASRKHPFDTDAPFDVFKP